MKKDVTEKDTVSNKLKNKIITKINWEENNQVDKPIVRNISKEELEKKINFNKRYKTSLNLKIEDKNNLEDVWHFLKKKNLSYTKSDVVSEALADIKRKYLE